MTNALNFKGINDAYHVIDALFFIKIFNVFNAIHIFVLV